MPRRPPENTNYNIYMRKLSTDEINMLMQQGCTAENWENITVLDDFMAQLDQETEWENLKYDM